MERKKQYRDGLIMWSEGESFTGPGGEIVEVFYDKEKGGDKTFFVELPGIPACAHGASLEKAIAEARRKQAAITPLTKEEKAEYRNEAYKFSVSLFQRITGACAHGTDVWLKSKNLGPNTLMTLAEIRAAGAGQWADELERRIKDD